MTLIEELHKSKAHREGFDPSCPKCLADHGLNGIIRHLESCAQENEADAQQGSGPSPGSEIASWGRTVSVIGADAVAKEQRRMIGILKLYRKCGFRP
jgi:hypothetical protein